MIPRSIVFFGPKSAFDKFLISKGVLKNNFKTLSEIVRLKDEESKSHLVRVEGAEDKVKEKISVENLVASSDEYLGVREHVLFNFEEVFSNIEIEAVYLHNPPKVLESRVEKSSGEYECVRHDYKAIDTKFISSVNETLGEKLVGQESAKRRVLKSLVPLARMGIKKPVVILFYGPSGVGKTETAKILAETLEGELFRKQFSMFQNNDFLSYLFGGSHSEKSFAKEVLDRQSNVILLDEFDKANSICHSAFYQLFDEGVYEDRNYSLSVGGAVIICTSNYQNSEEIKNHLGEPIFSRFDAHIEFKALSSNEVQKIISLNLKRQYSELSEADKALVDIGNFEEKFYEATASFKDARSIASSIKDAISGVILDSIL